MSYDVEVSCNKMINRPVELHGTADPVGNLCFLLITNAIFSRHLIKSPIQIATIFIALSTPTVHLRMQRRHHVQLYKNKHGKALRPIIFSASKEKKT